MRLPRQPTPLIGRDPEVTACTNLLLSDDARLVTLVGAAGTGKTRLALAVAEHAAAAFPDGVHFVDLASVTDSALLIPSVARSLGLRDDQERPLAQMLIQHLAERRILLLLDNFEQLIAAAPGLSDLLRECDGLKLLVTSRSALHLRWEQVVPVAPLAVPDLTRLPAAEALLEVPAVALFVQRVQRLDPAFRLTPAIAATVAEVCVRLDGLPLAIELAAARTRVLPAPSLVARLERRLSVLQGGPLDQPARQRTLRAALDWSYELLSPTEQALFRRLGVFVGGCTLDPVAEVCDLSDAGELHVLGTLEALLDRSLVQRQDAGAPTAGGEPRFRMLETIREYALERLQDSGELEPLRRRHAAYYLGGAEAVQDQIRSTHQAAWLDALEAEHGNIRAALAWCQERNEPDLALRAMPLLAWFWSVRGFLTEGRTWAAALLGMPGANTAPAYPEALRAAGSLALQQADYAAAEQWFGRSLNAHRASGDTAGLVGALAGLAATALQAGDADRSRALFEETLRVQEQLGDKLGMAETFNSLANIAHSRGELARARELYEQSLAINRIIGYRKDVVLHNMAVIAQEQGDLPAARSMLAESIAIKRSIGDLQGLAFSLAKLSEVASAQGSLGEAFELLAESLAHQHEIGDRAGMAFVLERFAGLAGHYGQPERALRLAAAAVGLRSAIGAEPGGTAAGPLPASAAGQPPLDPLAAYAAWQRGLSAPLAEVIEDALAIMPASQQQPAAAAPMAGPLTAREQEVARLIAAGCTNREIAEQLVITERTAAAHVEHILAKLSFSTRTQVAVWAAAQGLTGAA